MRDLGNVDIIDSWIGKIIESKLLNLHTALPGIVESFDADKQLAKVSPAITRVLINGETLEISPIIEVPVVFSSGGGFSITTPVSSGDDCLLIFCERSIDNWKYFGGVKRPHDGRMHNYTDAIAIVGARNQLDKLSDFSTNSVEIRNNSGLTKVSVSEDSVYIKASIGGMTINSDGSILFDNGATVTPTGDFVSSTGISLSFHTHTSPGGPPQ